MRDFGFAFNDCHLSDRVIRIEILSEESLDSESDYEVGDHHCLGKRKRRNNNLKENEKGDEAHSSDSDLEFSSGVKVEILHICSLILAEKSPFFYKLFKNGMRESQQRHLTIRINAHEEAAFMDLMKFIYSNTLSATTVPDLLDVLMVADKFEVISCMRYCSDLLLRLPMSLESALSYLELPSSVLVAEAVQPIIDAAKQCIVARYKDFIKSKDEVMRLPLSIVEIVLSSDCVEVSTEDSFFRLILAWARAHYPNLEERREILTKRLVQFICFPYMSCSKLKEVLVWPDFDHEQVSKLVLEALLFKAEVPYGQQIQIPIHPSRRVYKCRPIKVVQFEFPQPHCVVYFFLKKEECATLVESIQMSEPFYLDGKLFFLVAVHRQETHSFGLFVKMHEPSSQTCKLDFEFAVMEKPSQKFQSQLKAYDLTLTGHGETGCADLFGTSWTNFMRDDSDYFIDGCLHLRAELTIKNSQI